MKLFAIIVLVCASVATASCPSSCSGHGKCGEYDKCTCFARWAGADCATRQCAYGLSWVPSSSDADAPAGGELNGQHQYTECSSRGLCGEGGECECFAGYEGRGCRRTSCPNGCSGHGRCLYANEVSNDYPNYVSFDSQYWDGGKTRQCSCDRGYSGVDCSARVCPKGDDPLTDCNSDQGTSRDDVQTVSFTASGLTAGFFTLTFTDMFNGMYTTKAIDLGIADANALSTTAGDVKAALEELPNFAIPDVTVSFAHAGNYACAETATGGDVDATDTAACLAATGGATATACEAVQKDAGGGAACTATPASYDLTVTFVDPANSGEQHLLEVNDDSGAYNTPNMQPRFATFTGTTSVSHDTTHFSGNQDQYKEHVSCSNRGNCDTDSGLCECYEGYTGEACNQQTVFF